MATFPTPFLLTAPKETVGQVSPDGEFLFVRTKRNQKCAGGQARMTFSPQRRGFGQSACTPGPPFYGGPVQEVQPPISGVEVSRRPLLPIPAAALLAVVEGCRAHGTRLHTAGASTRRFCRGPQALLLWHASAAAAQGCQTVLVTSAPVVEWQAVDHGIALFFGGPTPFL